MPVSSLLERMRKKLQEKAAATNSADGPSPPTTTTATTTAGASTSAAKIGSSTGDDGGLSGGASSAAHRAEPALPLPPPVFASPSSARLDYRDVVGDPLCVPFTADMAAPLLERVLQMLTAARGSAVELTRGDCGGTSALKPAQQLPSSTLASTNKVDSSCTVVNHAARHMYELLSVGRADGVTPAVPPSPAAAAPPPLPPPQSLYDDSSYTVACARGHVEVSGAVRPMCRDVNYYTRVGRISQGVYGVVFHAVAAAAEDDDADAETALSASTGEQSPPAQSPPPPARRSYALKHIKKMWLEESQVGFPPYLLREIDLLLRLKHPNIMGARELVLLDAAPLPQPVKATPAALADSHQPAGVDGDVQEREEKGKEGFLDGPPALQRPRTEEGPPSTTAATAVAPDKNPAAARPLAAVGAVSETKDVFLVMDYCPSDLTNYMRRYHTTPTHQIPFFHVTPRNAHPDAAANYVARAKSIALQLFRSVAFMHANRILHRDLKSANVLLDSHGYVKVCDFGLGRLYREGQGLTPTVVTLMYRAPELHLGVVDYSHKMDVWSLGCILAELFLRRPLFHASTDSHHLLAVCNVIGIPTEETFPALYHLPHTKVMMQSLPLWNRASRLASLFQPGATMSTSAHGEAPVACEATLLPPEGLELLRSILQWNPRRRPSAAEVLQHPFFHTAPLPCAPAELMRPMPWRDAAPPSEATRRPPPPQQQQQQQQQQQALSVPSAVVDMVCEVTATSDRAEMDGGTGSMSAPPPPQVVTAVASVADVAATEQEEQEEAAAAAEAVRLSQLNTTYDSVDDAEDAS